MRDPSTEFARSVLSAAGFRVEPIPTNEDAQRADLRATIGGEEYVIEAKLREPEARWFDLYAAASARGGATMSRSVEPWNALSKTIRKAHRQLMATPRSPDALCVLWVVAPHPDGEFVTACFEKRLLGLVNLLLVKGQRLSLSTKPCFYHSGNDFERCRGLDGAVVGTERGARLLINHFSPRRDQLRRSRLHALFGKAVVDAEQSVLRGEALMLDSDFVGQRDGAAQWEYLMRKYGVATAVMMDSQFNGLVVGRAS